MDADLGACGWHDLPASSNLVAWYTLEQEGLSMNTRAMHAVPILITASILLSAPPKTLPQPRGPDTFWSLEGLISQSDSVVLGRFASTTVLGYAPATMMPVGRFVASGPGPGLAVRIHVDETLKGRFTDKAGALLPLHRWNEKDPRYEQWVKAGTRFLVFIGPPSKEGRTWSYLRTGTAVEAEKLSGGHLELPIRSRDLTQINNEEQALARAREYAKTSKGVRALHALKMPGHRGIAYGSLSMDARVPCDNLMVPVDRQLEELAKTFIAKDSDLMQFSGAEALKYFKSDPNAELLRSILREASPAKGLHAPDAQAKAFEVLLNWNLEPPTPTLAEQISELDLRGESIGDEQLRQVARVPNVKRLNLLGTKVTANGLQALVGLKKLDTVFIEDSRITDSVVMKLGELKMLHTLWVAATRGGNRATSEGAVGELNLAWTAISDRCLSSIAGLKNLVWLDIRDTKVTDSGVEALFGLKNLKDLLLGGSKVTRVGRFRLQVALPDCRIR